jgi:hypothetical protein
MRSLASGLLPLAFALISSASAAQPVYLLPMPSGFDQYLAGRLAAAGLYRIVTDPKLAEAVFTDQVGAPFEQKLHELFPPPKPAVKDDKEDSRPEKRPYTGGTSRGTLFLVDLKSRTVIWSGFFRPPNRTPKALDQEATRIVHQIQKDQEKP